MSDIHPRYDSETSPGPKSSVLWEREGTLAPGKLTFRREVAAGDLVSIREIVQAAGVFSAAEVELAVELVAERLAKGLASGYRFILAESEGRVAGYTCFGPIPCTLNSYDLYWIAVLPGFRWHGLGRRLLEETEREIMELGGTRIYVETSSRPDYTPAREFYRHRGYSVVAQLTDFYSPGDNNVIYMKSADQDKAAQAGAE